MSSSSVTALQQDLKTLGYLHVNPTGYFGSLTKSAVMKLQADNGIAQDGVAGPVTMSVINRLLNGTSATSQTTPATRSGSRSEARADYLVSWFGGAENILAIGSTAQVYDIWTGRTFNIKRTYGYNHADVETLTAEDTKIMCKYTVERGAGLEDLLSLPLMDAKWQLPWQVCLTQVWTV